mmetsp:Transcript_22891/g.32764  ORF Transcript_22891/g.32764 Transcript_22891/m.32764 type:complete len:206 (-) Transcript_22891:1381-1998(-)
MDLDSHADTCVVSETLALVTQDYMRPVRVHAYDGSTSDDTKNCKTVSAVVAYDSPSTGEPIYLVINQAICVPNLESILLCPNQMRDNDVMINDEPKSMVDAPTDVHHCITIQQAVDDPIRILLLLRGVTSYFPARKPTKHDFAQAKAEQIIHLTNEDIEWDPSDTQFVRAEEAIVDSNFLLRQDLPPRRISSFKAQRVVESYNPF